MEKIKISLIMFACLAHLKQFRFEKSLKFENLNYYLESDPSVNEILPNISKYSESNLHSISGVTTHSLKTNFTKLNIKSIEEGIINIACNDTGDNSKRNSLKANESDQKTKSDEKKKESLKEENGDPAVFPLFPPDEYEKYNEELEYVDLTEELINDRHHARILEYYEDLERKREKDEQHLEKLRRKRSVNKFPDSLHFLNKLKKKTKIYKWRNFDDFWDHYKVMRDEIENSQQGKALRKYVEAEKQINKKKKLDQEKLLKREKRGKLPVTLQDLNELNQFLLTVLETVRSWLVYEENGKVPRPKMALETLLKAFELYYECMSERFRHYEKTLSQPMTDVAAFNTLSSEKVTLECKSCLPPFTNPFEYGIAWYRRLLHEGGAYKALPNNENQFSVTLDGDLTMHQLTPEDAGMYTCFNNEAHGMTYMMGIDDVESRVRVYEHGDGVALATKPEILAEYNLYVFYQWSTWTACNRCNGPGSRKRVGTCMVKKFDRNIPTRPVDSSSLRKYKEGLPCVSPLIAFPLYEAANLKDRKTELMVSLCYNACVTQPPVRVVTDENGKQLDVVAGFKGRSSYYEGVPKLGVPIERLTEFAIMNKKYVLKCPHQNASKLPIRWQNGTFVLEESKLGYLTKFRVKVNQRNELVINRVLKSDEAFFSCWNNLQHFGTIRLYVREQMNFRNIVLDAIRHISFIVTLGMLLYIAFKLYFMGARAPKQYK